MIGKNFVHQETADFPMLCFKTFMGLSMIFNDKSTITEGLKLFSGN